jgi:hypothetical protein
MRRFGPLSPRFEMLVPDRLVRVVAADDVVLLMPALGGAGRVPAARGRAVALRVEPLGYRRLAPDGLPSLTRIRSRRRCWLNHAAALSRARGSRALIPSRCA